MQHPPSHQCERHLCSGCPPPPSMVHLAFPKLMQIFPPSTALGSSCRTQVWSICRPRTTPAPLVNHGDLSRSVLRPGCRQAAEPFGPLLPHIGSARVPKPCPWLWQKGVQACHTSGLANESTARRQRAQMVRGVLQPALPVHIHLSPCATPAPAAARHLVYCLISPNGRRYVGQTSSSLETRLKHHSRQPPRRMARDLRLYGHIQRFQAEILAVGLTNVQADDTEESYIKIFKASGPAGYNNLPGCPGRSRLFWWRYSTAKAQKAKTHIQTCMQKGS